jgi:hypothetical protein
LFGKIEVVSKKIFTKENLLKIAENLNRNQKEITREVNGEKRTINIKIRENEKKNSNLLKGIEKEIYENTIINRINELKADNEALLFRLSQLEDNIPTEYKEKDIEGVVKIIKQGLENADPEKLNHFLKIFIDEIIVHEDKLEFHYTFPKIDGDLSAFWMVPKVRYQYRNKLALI